jgi:hypothetical protein
LPFGAGAMSSTVDAWQRLVTAEEREAKLSRLVGVAPRVCK